MQNEKEFQALLRIMNQNLRGIFTELHRMNERMDQKDKQDNNEEGGHKKNK